jgi:hypothetical protein
MKDDTLLFLGAGLAAYFLIIKPEQEKISKLVDDFAGAQSALGNAFNFQLPNFNLTMPNFDFSNFNPAPTLPQAQQAAEGLVNQGLNIISPLPAGAIRNEWGSGVYTPTSTVRVLSPADNTLVSATFSGSPSEQQAALKAMYPYFSIPAPVQRGAMSTLATPTPSAIPDGGALQYAAQDWNAQSHQQPASGTPAYAAQQAYYASQAKGGGPTFGNNNPPNTVIAVNGGYAKTDELGNIVFDTSAIINESAKKEAEKKLGVK